MGDQLCRVKVLRRLSRWIHDDGHEVPSECVEDKTTSKLDNSLKVQGLCQDPEISVCRLFPATAFSSQQP